MTSPPHVWCAIPVYNNAATVKDIAIRARAQLDHVLVIDDGSTDADLEQLFSQTRESRAPGGRGSWERRRPRRLFRRGGALSPP